MKGLPLRFAAGGTLPLVVGVDAESAQGVEPAQAPATAQWADEQVAGGDIIVSAQKRSERINDVPLLITAAMGEELAAAGVTGTAQLAKIVPGLFFQLSPDGTVVYGLRGISFFETSGISQPAVGVYVDQKGAPLP